MIKNAENTLILLHSPPTDPRPFLTRTLFLTQIQAEFETGLLKLPSVIPHDVSTVPWRIDNRYYTAEVHFELVPFSKDNEVQAENVPIVIYLFDGYVSFRRCTMGVD